jgi:hypothetical protein
LHYQMTKKHYLFTPKQRYQIQALINTGFSEESVR